MLVHIFPCTIKLSLLTHIHKFNIDALVFTFINVTFSYANKDLLIKKLVIKKVVLAQQEITAEDYLHKNKIKKTKTIPPPCARKN